MNVGDKVLVLTKGGEGGPERMKVRAVKTDGTVTKVVDQNGTIIDVPLYAEVLPESSYQIDRAEPGSQHRLIIWNRDPQGVQSIDEVYASWDLDELEALRKRSYPNLPEHSAWDRQVGSFEREFLLLANHERAPGLLNTSLLNALEHAARELDVQVDIEAGDYEDRVKAEHTWSFLMNDLIKIGSSL